MRKKCLACLISQGLISENSPCRFLTDSFGLPYQTWSIIFMKILWISSEVFNIQRFELQILTSISLVEVNKNNLNISRQCVRQYFSLWVEKRWVYSIYLYQLIICSELKLFFVFILIGVSFLWSWIVAFGDSTPNTTEKSEWVPHSPFRALFCFDDDITDNSLFSLQSK